MIMTPQCPCVISSSVKTNVVLSTPEHKYGALGYPDSFDMRSSRHVGARIQEIGRP